MVYLKASICLRYLGVDRQWFQNNWDRTLIEEEQIHEQDRHQKIRHLSADSADRIRQATGVGLLRKLNIDSEEGG